MTPGPVQPRHTHSVTVTADSGLRTVTPTMRVDRESTAIPSRTIVLHDTVEPSPIKPTGSITELPQDRIFLGAYDLENQMEKRPLDVEMDYFDWVKYDAIGRFIYDTAMKGRIPVVSLEPWTTTSGQQPDVLKDTSDGLNDEIIRNVAKTVQASSQQQVLVRWAQEPELVGLYPWSLEDPRPYIEAFRRIHRIFDEEGVTNTLWLWSPAGNVNCMAYYPGAEYVDMVGITVFGNRDWDIKNGVAERSTFEQIFGEKYDTVSSSGKPVVVAELGVSGSREFQRKWLHDAFAAMPRSWPDLHGVIYFNAINAPNGWSGDRPDWRIDPSMLPGLEEMPRKQSRKAGTLGPPTLASPTPTPSVVITSTPTQTPTPIVITSVVTAFGGYVRSGPSVNQPVIGAVERGDQLVLVGVSGNWYQVRLGTPRTARSYITGEQGWISRNLVAPPSLPVPEIAP